MLLKAFYQPFHYRCPSVSESCWSRVKAPKPKPNFPFGTKRPVPPPPPLLPGATPHVTIHQEVESLATRLWKSGLTSWRRGRRRPPNVRQVRRAREKLLAPNK